MRALVFAGFVLAVSCTQRPSSHDEPTPPQLSRTSTPGLLGTSIVAGTVRWKGPPVAERTAPLTFPECRDRKPIPPVLVSPTGGLANAFVWIKDGLPAGDYPIPAEPVVLDQRACEYAPRVFGVRAGQKLVLKNSDDMLHNVHARGGGAGVSTGPNSFNVAMPLKGMTLTRFFANVQVPVPIGCDVHPWMRAFAGVVAHPFWSVSREDGAFELATLPPGTFTLGAWHERLGTRELRLVVGEGAKVEAEIVFAP